MTINGVPAQHFAAQRRQQLEPPQQVATPATRATEAFSAQTEVANAFRAHVDSVAAQRDRLTPSGQEALITEFASSPAAQALAAKAHAVAAYRDEAAAAVRRLRDSLITPGDSAQEQRNSRTWSKVKSLLDAADDSRVGVVARQELANADRSQIGVILEMLPSYLEAKGQQHDWMDVAVAQAVPELADAQRVARDAERQYETIVANDNMLRRGFASGTVPQHLVDPSTITG